MFKKIFSRLFPYDRQFPGFWGLLGCLWSTATLTNAFQHGFTIALLPTAFMSLFSFGMTVYALPKRK